MERLIKRCAHVVGIFPNDVVVFHLICPILVEQPDEWQVRRRYISASF